MIQEFLTIEEAAKRLEGRGYTPRKVKALIEAKSVPYHVRDKVVLIPFPEADPHFPPILPEPKEEDAPDAPEDKNPKGRK